MGYTYEGMTKISYEEALERFNNDLEVYILYDDNTEALVESIEDIIDHYGIHCDAEFGYEHE